VIRCLAPEIISFLLAVAVLIAAMGKGTVARLYRFALLGGGAIAGAAVLSLGADGTFFYGSYRVDVFSQIVKLFIASGTFLCLFVMDERSRTDLKRYYAENVFFLLTSNLGMMMLVSSLDFLTLFLSLELSSFSLYILVGLLKARRLNVEASMKYLFYGALASGLTLFGYALLYPFYTDTTLVSMAAAHAAKAADPLVYAGVVLLLSAFFFKLAVLPFSFWAPDVYQAGSNPAVTYIATVSKVAGVAVLLRILHVCMPALVKLEHAYLAFALVTMTFGNLTAIHQKDLKRLLAYSSIAQAGYIMVALVILREDAWTSALFYVFSYLVMNFMFMLVVDVMSKDRHSTELTSLQGLSRTSPLLALGLLVAVLSLGGVPPFVGFTGKWLIFSAAIRKGHTLVVLLSFLNSVVSVYYYLLVARQAYLVEPKEEPKPLTVSLPVKAFTLACLVYIVFFGINPSALLRWAERAVKALIGT
jgi:NADH-quinone oxidoreductase subunit N